MQETGTSLLASKHPVFLERFRDAIVEASEYRGDLTVVVRPESIREVIRFLKTDPSTQFSIMMDLFANDYLKYDPPTPERYAIIYNLYSLQRHPRDYVAAPPDKGYG